MIYIELMGGLGNQLFQIFCLLSYSFTHKLAFRIKANKSDTVSPLDMISKRPTYWNNFLKNLSSFIYYENIKLPAFKESEFPFTEIPYYQQDFRIVGYFQSYKYFESQYDKITQLIRLENQKQAIKEKYKQYFHKKAISIHFRIGDYIINPERHPILPISYYITALKRLSERENIEEYNVLYFGEERDAVKIKENIKSIQGIFPTVNFIQCAYKIEDWEQMLLMSVCHHNIMANSSFSWWGAYFNNNIEKIVYYPNTWFGPAMILNLKDLFPENWIKINEYII